ncbi:MAG: replication factor C large subunit [Candidatus ainarchaeum sp.]|nr:replication factor C large subunit [Candidatus ainarchaeum sp.]
MQKHEAQLFTEKFFPRDFREFIGNSEIAKRVQEWGSAWCEGKKQKPLLFYGSAGVGKTCLALLTAKFFSWQLFELNASDFRSKEIIERNAAAAAQNASFFGTQRLVLLDEVDGLQSQDRGGAGAIAKILREASNPVILTANEIYGDQKILQIKSECELLEFRKINFLSIAKRLREICEIEKISFEEEAVKELAKASAGDFRSALLDIQALAEEGISRETVAGLGFRARQENVFKIIEKIFKAKTISEAREARFRSDISEDLLEQWIDENIPRHFTQNLDMANAFSMLSRADIFEGRVLNRQHYGFKRYSSELMTAGVALSRANDYHGWVQYQFPGLLKKLSSNKGTRAMKKSIGEKTGRLVHSGAKEFIAKDLVFFRIFFAKNPEAFSATFDFDEKEIAFLLDTKPETKKVQKIFEKAVEIKKHEFALKRKPLQALEEKQFEKISKAAENKEENPEDNEKKAFSESPSQTKLF